MNTMPAIKTLCVNNKFYFYDGWKNRLIKVTKEHYDEILKLQKMGVEAYNIEKSCKQSYNDLKILIEKGFFKSNDFKHIVHPETKYLKSLLDRSVGSLVLQVTQDCNFKCRYCLYAENNQIERNHKKLNMKWDIAKQSIDFLFEHSKDSRNINIVFYGGEPLINFDLIKTVTDYANNVFCCKKINYYITTNGSLLTNSIINYLIKNDVNLTVSLDGPKEIQDNHRRFAVGGKGTFDVVFNNVRKLMYTNKSYFVNKVNFAPVAFFDENISKIIDFFERQNISYQKVNIKYANLNGIDYWHNPYSKKNGYSSMLDINKDPHSLQYRENERILMDKNTVRSKWHHNGPCVPGVRRLFVDLDGNFYPCEKCVENPGLVIGNVKTGFVIKQVEKMLNIAQLSRHNCRNCWAFRFCNICAVKCVDITQGRLTPSSKAIVCNEVKKQTENFLKEYIKNKG